MDYISELFGNPYLMLGFCAAFLGVVALITYFLWDKIKKRFRGVEKFPTLLIHKEPKISEDKLEIYKNFYLIDDETREAWFIHPDAVQKSPDGSIAELILTRDSSIPQFAGVEVDIENICAELKKTSPDIFFDHVGEAVFEVEERNQRNPLADSMGTALLGMVGLLGVVCLIVLVTSDVMPW